MLPVIEQMFVVDWVSWFKLIIFVFIFIECAISYATKAIAEQIM